jgi:hypothetical protein
LVINKTATALLGPKKESPSVPKYQKNTRLQFLSALVFLVQENAAILSNSRMPQLLVFEFQILLFLALLK